MRFAQSAAANKQQAETIHSKGIIVDKSFGVVESSVQSRVLSIRFERLKRFAEVSLRNSSSLQSAFDPHHNLTVASLSELLTVRSPDNLHSGASALCTNFTHGR